MKHIRMEQARARAENEVVRLARGESDICPLCGRQMIAGASLNVHHLVPRMFGGRETATIHRVCHSKIHSVFSEAELAREYHTFEKLRSHHEMASFIKWVRKQDPERNSKHARPRR